MQWWRRTAQAIGDVLGARRPLTMRERIAREERAKRAYMARQPSAIERERREEATAMERAERAADQMARELAWGRAVFPGQPGTSPVPVRGWPGSPVTDEDPPAPTPTTARDEDLSSPNPNRHLKWIVTDDARRGRAR